MSFPNRYRFALVAVALVAGCAKPVPPAAPVDVRAAQVASLPSTADDPAWAAAAVFAAPLLLQDMVEPRKMQVGAPEVRVQALTDGRSVVFRMAWADSTEDSTHAPARFTDACAVQLPASISVDSPAPQMGERGRPVEITFWSASAQASVDGRPDDIKTLYPNAQIDHYPFMAPALEANPVAKAQMEALYAPARSLGNIAAVVPKKAVQDLLAEGPGSLSPAPATTSDGRGKRDPQGWVVIISRPLPKGVLPGSKTQVAFAVWNGSAEDVGARKMRTAWIPLVVGATGAAK